MRKVATGVRYDGLYSVDDAYDLLGKSGFRICRYELNEVASTTAGTARQCPRVSYSLTAPDSMPRMNCRWNARHNATTGSEMRIAAAARKLV